ncbi:MAG TPA: hypothetical protein VHW09_26830 [Bryobacteraceae bacterium]|jgi:hypothetical protein|nr:hypothetical protein [Bryobacteraceae bacterium]
MRFTPVLLLLILAACNSLADHLDKPGVTTAQKQADQGYCRYKATLATASGGTDIDRFNVEEQCMLHEKGYQRVAGRED